MTTDYSNLNYTPEVRRNIGRLQTRWEDDFREEGTGQRLIVDDDYSNNNNNNNNNT